MRMSKKLALVLFLCAALTSSFASLVQSAAGGSASGTVASGGSITTSAAGFAGSTVSGDLLIIVIYVTSVVPGGDFAGLNFDDPVVSGGYSGSFLFNAEGYWGDTTSSLGEGNAAIYYLGNAPSMSPTQTVTVQANNGASVTATLAVEFDLYEFNNVVFPLVMDLGIDGVSRDSHTASVPSNTFSSTTHTNLILSAFTSQASGGSNISAGSGYTLGINASTAVVGQMQYQLAAAPAQTSAAFSGASQGLWGAAAISFEVNTSPPIGSGVKRHRGWIN